MKRTLLTLTLLAAAIGGCATPKKPVAQIGDIPPGAFQKTWAVDSSLSHVDRAYLTGNTLFLYGETNTVAAFDADGVPQFRNTVGQKSDIVGPPMVQEKRLIFPTSSTLEIMTTKGVITRSIPMAMPPRSPGVLIGETVFIGCDSTTGGRIAAIAMDKLYNIYRWTLLTGIVHTQPATQNNYLFAATEDGRVYALTLERANAWPKAPEMPDGIFHADGKILTALAADEAGVYVPSADTKLYCLDPATGRLRWEYFAGVPLNYSPVPTTNMVYIYVRDQGIVALPKKTPQRINTPKWAYNEGKQLLADDATYAYILTTAGRVAAIEKATGTLKFTTKRSDFVLGLTHVDPKDAGIYVISKDNELVCIHPVLKMGVVGELVLNDSPVGR